MTKMRLKMTILLVGVLALLGGVMVAAQDEAPTRPLDTVLEAFAALDAATSYRLLTEEDTVQQISGGEGRFAVSITQQVSIERKGILGSVEDTPAASVTERRFDTAALGEDEPQRSSILIESVLYLGDFYSRSTSAADGDLPESWFAQRGAVPAEAANLAFYKELISGLRFTPTAENVLVVESLDPLTTPAGDLLQPYRVTLNPQQVFTTREAAQLLDPRLFGSDREALFTSQRQDAAIELLIWVNADGLPARVDTIIGFTLELQSPLSDGLLRVTGRRVASDVYTEFGADLQIAIPEVE